MLSRAKDQTPLQNSRYHAGNDCWNRGPFNADRTSI